MHQFCLIVVLLNLVMTIDDTHNFTGSLQTSGSFNLNDYSVTEISNDTLY